MQQLKLIYVPTLALLLTACTSQMQIEGRAGGKPIYHSHEMPGGTEEVVHSHGAPNHPQHSHSVSDIKKMLEKASGN